MKCIRLNFGVHLSLFLLFLWIMNCANPAKEEPLVQLSPKGVAGRYLFFDTRLSFNNTKSCASCHDPKFAFTDGYRRSTTATGDAVIHNTPTLINSASMRYYDWANPEVENLEQQHQRPLFNTNPVELGVSGFEREILTSLAADTLYSKLFQAAFPLNKGNLNFKNITSCLAEYVKSLKSYNSAFDLHANGQTNVMSVSARRGMKLFFSPKMNCPSCHRAADFTLATTTNDVDSIYVNIGLYNTNNSNRYPATDPGLQAVTGKARDNGKFRIPTLRNVAMTAPYFHDGSVATLEEVVDIYAAGGRDIISGPNKGNGKNNLHKDTRIKGFSITPQEKSALIDFLYVLSDSTIFSNPNFQNPFKSAHNY